VTRRVDSVRLSSKGQVVIPVGVRRALRLRAGQQLRIRRSAGEIVLTPATEEEDPVAMLRRAQAWAARNRRDLVGDLHRRRASERLGEGERRGRRRP
jgi:AbrB family looped-hinge helix DNA binding protein